MRSMHLDEDQVQRLLHGELTSAREIEAQQHLAGCDVCRESMTAARREETELFALLGAVDDPVPAVDVAAIQRRAGTVGTRRLSWAAGIIVALGIAGVAYAAPGSPLQRWMTALTGWLRQGPAATQASSTAPPPASSAVAGVAVVPGQRLVIAFTSMQAEGTVRVRLIDSAQVVVRAPSGAGTFTSDADRLVIDNRDGRGTFEVDIPRTAPRVEIVIGGMRRFLKDDDRVAADGPAETAGVYVIPLGGRVP
jgi:anti-sigma factor RsiW